MGRHTPSPAPRNEKSILDCIVNAVSEKKMVAVISAAMTTALAPSSALAVPTCRLYTSDAADDLTRGVVGGVSMFKKMIRHVQQMLHC